MAFDERRMGGLVEMNASAMEDDEVREAVLALAKEFVGSLPAK